MHKQKVLYFILLCIFFAVPFKFLSQISSDVVHGCSPLNVHFTGIPGGSAESWSLGVNGVVASGHTPSQIYVTPGTYNITYSAMVSGSPTTAVMQVTVFPNPSASLTYVLPASHCKPMTVQFTASGGVAGSTYYLNYGNLSTGTGTNGNILYTYNVSGIFSPTLTVTDAVTGCNGTVTVGPVIQVSDPPVVNITAMPGFESCNAPFITSFSSNGSSSGSPIGNSLTYNWTFGNGAPASSQQNPANISYNMGQFPVVLTVTDDNHCSNSATQMVTVSQPTLSITAQGTVCPNQDFTVTAQSSQQNLTWIMGDGGVENFSTPIYSVATTNTIHIYTTPGVYTVSATASMNGCQTTQTTIIVVEGITPQFTSSTPTAACGPSVAINFQNTSSVTTNVPLTYLWSPNFSWDYTNYALPATTSTLANPTYTFYQYSPNPYTIYGPFEPVMFLFIHSTSVAQCTAVVAHTCTILQRPTAWFNTNTIQGCAPLAVNFRDSSFTMQALNPVTSYTWNSGTNPPTIVTGTPTNQSPPYSLQTFSYTAPGTYTPFYIIKTAWGCIDTSFVDTIRVSNPPTVTASFPPTVCAGQSVQINMSASPTPSLVDHWHVSTDNGFFSGCITNPNPIFPFTHTGTMGVVVTGYQTGCAGTTTLSQNITVLGPMGKTRAEINCTTPKVIKFYSYLQDVQTATLSFGDATSAVLTGVPGSKIPVITTHSYALTGNYTATLSSVNPANAACGTHIFTLSVKVRNLGATITTTPTFPGSTSVATVCVNQAVTFSVNSTDAVTGCMRGYIWNFHSSNPQGNHVPATDLDVTSFQQSFGYPGIYTVALTVHDVNECALTVTKQFRVSDANPTFTFNTNPICFSALPVNIINTTSVSLPYYPDPITNFNWNFGDGQIANVNTTATQTHSYSNVQPPGAPFYVVLTATNSMGCVNSKVHVLTVSNPSAHFIGRNWACIPEALTFTCPAGYKTYTLTYGDSASALTRTTSMGQFAHNYTTPGDWLVKLGVTDTNGCVNSESVTIAARAIPVANFTTVGNANLCVPANITFTNTSTTSDPTHSLFITWDVGAGPIQTNSNIATNVFVTPGTTTISIIVSPLPGGLCSDTASKTVYVYDTHATLKLNKTKFCVGDTVIAKLTGTQDADVWICNVGFGIQPMSAPIPSANVVQYTYTNAIQTGSAYVLATVSSPHDACVISTNSVNIELIKLNPGFMRNNELTVADSAHCIKIPDKFTPGVSTTTSSVTYNWDFGNGSTTTAPNPTYIFPAPGVYPVTLTASVTGLGCNVTTVKNMTISPQPTATVEVADNCPGVEFGLQVAGSPGIVSGTWTPTRLMIMVTPATFTLNGNTQTFSATATASASTDFTLSVIDDIGCASDPVKGHVNIQQPAPARAHDTTIVIGESVPIDLSVGSGFSYSWTPVTTGLSCFNCPNPTANSTVNITYTVIITDQLNCAAVASTYSIIILPKISVDVPTAFTPNGDNVNDIVFVGGWGIKKLNYFRIYNRWGELLFESNDIKIGWNGYFNGVPQNMETYVYQVSAESYIDDKPILKTGTVKIIR